jgi:hypothetical protein
VKRIQTQNPPETCVQHRSFLVPAAFPPAAFFIRSASKTISDSSSASPPNRSNHSSPDSSAKEYRARHREYFAVLFHRKFCRDQGTTFLPASIQSWRGSSRKIMRLRGGKLIPSGLVQARNHHKLPLVLGSVPPAAVLRRINDVHTAAQTAIVLPPALSTHDVPIHPHSRQSAHNCHPVLRQVFGGIPRDLFAIGGHFSRSQIATARLSAAGNAAFVK